MKSIAAALALVAASIPGVASAGSSYFPHYIVNQLLTQADGTKVALYTTVHVTNILAVSQDIRLVFHNLDGTPLTSYPVTIWNGSFLNPYSATTDSEGALVLTLAPGSQVGVELNPAASPVAGWGTIEGTSGYNKSLLADLEVFGRIPDWGFPGTASYNISYVVNGGSPF